MNAPTLRLLHVEDDRMQQRVVAHYLRAVGEYQFDVRCAVSEEEAVRVFDAGGIEFVILDYHLTQGNGLSCLRHIRERDPMVPILAISGAATSEVAAELVRAGADDFIGKAELTSEVLARSVRASAERAFAFRRQMEPTRAGEARAERLARELCRDFLARLGDGTARGLDECEAAVREAGLRPDEVSRLFERACRDLDAEGRTSHAWLAARPLMLEVVFRLFGAGKP